MPYCARCDFVTQVSCVVADIAYQTPDTMRKNVMKAPSQRILPDIQDRKHPSESSRYAYVQSNTPPVTTSESLTHPLEKDIGQSWPSQCLLDTPQIQNLLKRRRHIYHRNDFHPGARPPLAFLPYLLARYRAQPRRLTHCAAEGWEVMVRAGFGRRSCIGC
jgi:hypothetical protein